MESKKRLAQISHYLDETTLQEILRPGKLKVNELRITLPVPSQKENSV
jgi:hypothetical protein